jgi:hypothetical protein
VPYTGATQDVDLDDNGLDAKFVKIKGTAGNGHLNFKHQSSGSTAGGSESVLYADNSGNPKWKNDGNAVQNVMLENSAITGATKTKITYDAKGLVTAGADATTADIADSTNKRYVTDAQLTVIGNTSGTNTGDETQASILSKLGFFVNNRTTDTTAVTGTTTETIIDSVLIPANTYSASGGILRLYNSKFSKTGTAGTLRIKIYVGPNAGNLTGATLLADSGSLASTIVYSEMLRTFTVGSSTLKGIGSGVVSLTDVVSSNSARSSIAWNPAIDNYIHYTVINGSSADSTVMIGNSVKNF